jgi:hypothetical protein
MIQKTIPTTLQFYTNEFWTAQGEAMAAYANLEHSMSMLFSHLSGMPPDIANIVFCRILNSPTTGKILESLLEKKYPDVYSKFWKSLKCYLKELVETRNQIVHWRVTTPANDFTGIKLLPPDYWTSITNKSVGSDQIKKFIEECNFFSQLTAFFFNHLQISAPSDGAPLRANWQTWRDIFRIAATYPPPTDHPLSTSAQSLQMPAVSSSQ